MKKIFKRTAVVALVVGLVAGGVNAPAAEALSLGGIGNLLGAGKGTDINTANKRMLENFYYSVALIAAAYQNVQIATDDSIVNKQLITQDQAVKSARKDSDAGLQMKNGAEQNKADAEKMKKYLSEALASGDEAKLAEIDNFIKTANTQRTLSNVMAGVSYTQAGIILMAQVKGAASGNLEGIGNAVAIANETKQMLEIRKELSKLLDTATAEYRKARGIKDPSKKEQKEAAAQIEKG